MLQADKPFVTVCAYASLFMHKLRQALRAQVYSLSKCSTDASRKDKNKRK